MSEVSGGIARCERCDKPRGIASPVKLCHECCPYPGLAFQLGSLVAEKQIQYGDSAGRTAEVLRVYFPDGIHVHQYGDVLLLVRVLDKLSRIAQRREDGRDLGGESPWQDIGGYGLLGWAKDEER